MRFFLNTHPYVSLFMLGMVCVTVIKTAYIIKDGGTGKPKSIFSKNDEDDVEDED